MTSTNSIGIRIAGFTIILLLFLFSMWKMLEFGVSKYQQFRMPLSLPTPTITPQVFSSPVPQESLNPQLAQQLFTAQQTLVGYTKQYIESLPADIPKDQVLDPKNIQAFIEKNKGVLLPELRPGTVKTTTSAGKKAIQAYLDKISASHNKQVVPITGDAIITALGKQQSGEDVNALAPILASIEKNFSLFTAIQVPKEAVALHTKLLQGTLSLIDNVKLLQQMRQDVIAGLIGQRNLTDLNDVFSSIATQIAALERKYGIK